MLFHQRNTCISFIFAVKFYASAIFSHARQLTLFVCHQTKENLTCVDRGRCPQLRDRYSFKFTSWQRLPLNTSGLPEELPDLWSRSADEKHGIGGKGKTKREKGTGISSILLLSGGHNNELTILHLLIQQMDYFKLHKHF